MSFLSFLILCLTFWLSVARGSAGGNNTSAFVCVKGEFFQQDGRLFRPYGTNAYWLPMALDDDIDRTLHDIATAGFSVVRTWAFNDVASKPTNGPYFQILSNGNATINEGPDGLQRLDKVVATAGKYGLKLLLTLTNNWNPERAQPGTAWNRRANDDLPRGYLSNDYGGMDMYVRALVPGGTHDQFYTNPDIISAFRNYVQHVVKRYANNPTVLGWELGNDLRCASTLPASSACSPETITKWANSKASYVKSLDSNHLVTAGDGGFYCLGCKKLYAKQSTPKSESLTGHAFDGSFGVDTEDILAAPSIDFGSFQLFPDQVTYLQAKSGSFATNAIGHGAAWVSLHSTTADLLNKPELLTAAGIVSQENWKFFVPSNSSVRMPENAPCGGVKDFQVEYAFVTWEMVGLTSKVAGVLEYMWAQNGLTSHLTKAKRDLTTSPNDGYQRYQSPYQNQTAAQASSELAPI